MKKVEAIINPHLLLAVQESLEENGVSGMTVMEVKGLGRTRGHVAIHRDIPHAVDFLPKTYIMVLVEDEQVHKVVTGIRLGAYTGKNGDGVIWVTAVES